MPTCRYDTVKPRLRALSFSTRTLDIAAGQNELVSTYRITDDGSGFRDGGTAFYFRGPAGQEVFGCISAAGSSLGEGNSCRRVDGDDYDGTYQTQVTWPAHVAAGTWTLYGVAFSDKAGNHAALNEKDLAAAGLPSTVTVVNPNSDTAKPRLANLSFDKSRLDFATGQQELVATYRITDNKSGFYDGGSAFYFRGPNGQMIYGCISARGSSLGPGITCRRIAGTDLDGTYQTRITWPSGAAAGTWTLNHVAFADNAGNRTSLDEKALQTAGMPNTVTVVNPNADTSKPVLDSLSFSTRTLSPSTGQAELVATYHIKDQGSGFADVGSAFYFRGPAGQEVYGCIGTDSRLGTSATCRRVSGNAHDGWYETRLSWPSTAAPGQWTLFAVSFGDGAGNTTALNDIDLAAAGLPTTITVE